MVLKLTILSGYFALSALETYLRVFQWVPRAIAMEHRLSHDARIFMLPAWYSWGWLPKLGRYGLLVLIWWQIGWWQAVFVWVAVLVASMVTPIPWTHAANIIERKLRQETNGPHAARAAMLLAIVRETRGQRGF